jgi:signal transduction histidine kinase
MESLVNERSDAHLRGGAARAPAAPPAPPEFFTSLGHDLRSQIGVVTEVLSELGADLDVHLTDEHRLLLTLANRSLRRVRRIADMVSLASTLDSGSFQLRRCSVDLVAVLRGGAALAAALEPRREVELACDLPAGPCPAVVDADRLGCAVSELLINALRHARRRVRLGLELPPGEARVTIEDDGQGVPADRRASLFRRHAPRPTHSGLGMGLAITHDLIAAHQGRLWLEASTLPPGRPGTTGARFVASFPLVPAPSTDQAPV